MEIAELLKCKPAWHEVDIIAHLGQQGIRSVRLIQEALHIHFALVAPELWSFSNDQLKVLAAEQSLYLPVLKDLDRPQDHDHQDHLQARDLEHQPQAAQQD